MFNLLRIAGKERPGGDFVPGPATANHEIGRPKAAEDTEV
jgi:hypothetical protein